MYKRQLNILSSVLYDSAKHFLRKGKPSIFNIRVRTKPDGRAELKIQLVTDDDEILCAAIDKMREIIVSATKGTLTYDPGDGEFHSIDGPTEELPDSGVRHDCRLDRAGRVAFGLARDRTQIAPDHGRTLVDVR